MTDAVAVKSAEKLTCGLIMPISQLEGLPPAHWDEVKEIITSAVEAIPSPTFTARLVSEGDDAGVIHKRIIQNVYSDDIAVCDVSGRNANVMFELGMRLAFDKPTVIVKDDQTPRIFDTDVIEYVTYRRDLRHGSMESFKAKLSAKIAATYQLSQTDHDKQSFLKSFGTFKVIRLDEASESPSNAMLTLLTQMERQLSRLVRNTPPKSSPSRSRIVEGYEDSHITKIATSANFEAAHKFIVEWAGTHPNFSSRSAIIDEDFLNALEKIAPDLATSPSLVSTLVAIAT